MVGLHILFVLIITFNSVIHSDGCFTLMRQNYGYITKDKDFLVNTTNVFKCGLHNRTTIHDGVAYNVSCDDLVIRFKNKDVPNTYCTDPLTREFVIENATVSDSGFYTCNIPHILKDKQNLLICAATYNFGYSPLPVENFGCVSKNFFNLTCSWKELPNPIKTNYSLYLQSFYFPSLQGSDCAVPAKESCRWSMSTQPIYYKNVKTLYFRITGNNTFGLWNKHYDINHYSIVWAGVPQDFQVLTIGTDYAHFNWSHPEYMDPMVSPNLTYEIWYKNEFDTNWTVTDLGIKITNVNLTGLIPNLKYKFALRCRVVEAPDLWSDYTNKTLTMLADVPYFSPRIVRQSFKVHTLDSHRKITLYWQGIDKKHCNAPGCGYEIIIFPTNIERRRRHLQGMQPLFIPQGITTAAIPGLNRNTDYEFVLYTKNELGRSTDFASIKIPKSKNMPMQPMSPSAVMNKTEYIIKWEHPANNDKLSSYTVAWCQNLNPRSYECTGKINWTNVPATNTSYSLVIPDDDFAYKFAVAANSELASSGLEWIPCVVPRNGVLDKLTEVKAFPKSSNNLMVTWNLECNALRRVVESYKITYGPCTGYCTEGYLDFGNCDLNEVQTVSVRNESYVIDNLKPYTFYKLKIAAITAAGISEDSETTCGRTSEAAPSDPPTIINFTNVSSHSAVVHWRPPKKPNGIIIKYEIYLDNHRLPETKLVSARDAEVFNYTINDLYSSKNYSVQISGCVQSDCSNKSEEHILLTKISEPGRMAQPRANAENSSTVSVSWDPPVQANGPIDHYVIRWRSENNHNENVSKEFLVPGSSMSANIDLQCNLVKPKNPMMITIQAVNVVDDQELVGPSSPPAKIAFCPPLGEVGAITIGVSIGTVLGLLVLIVILYVLVRWMKGKVDTMKKFEVVLPNGLDSPQSNPMSSYENFKNGLLTNPDLSPKPAYGRLDSFVSEDSFKNRHGSGTSQFSASSTDELIAKQQNIVMEKARRNPSGDSSGCGSTGGHDSLSSSLTHRTNLSSDSGNEADIKNPPSPEVAREGDLKDIKLDEKPIDVSRVSGSKDSGVDKGDDSDEKTKSPVSPYSQLSSCADANDKALGSFTPQAPYSKLGLESSYVPFSRGPHMTLYAHNLANSEPSINALDGVTPYTVIKAESQLDGTMLDPAKAMQYSKFGICKSSQDVTCGSEEGVVLPYSRFGMRKVPQNYVGHEMAYTVLTQDPKDIVLKNKQNPWITNMAVLSSPEIPIILPGKAMRTTPLNKPCVDTKPKEVDNLAYSKFGIGDAPYTECKMPELTVPMNGIASKPSSGYVAFEDAKILPISQMVADAEMADDGIEDDFEKSYDLGYNTMLNSDVTHSMDNLTNGGIAPYSCFLTSSLKDDVDVVPEPFSLSLADNIHAPPSYDDLKENISPAKSPLNVNGYLSRDALSPSSSHSVDERTSSELSNSNHELEKKTELRDAKTPKAFMDKNGYVMATELPSICGGKDARFNMPRTDV